MITLSLSDKKLFLQNTTCYAILLEQNFVFSKELQAIADVVYPALKHMLHDRKFTGKLGSTLVVPFTHHERPAYLILAGVGKAGHEGTSIPVENYRRALGKIVRTVEGLQASSVTIQIPAPQGFGVSASFLLEQTASLLPIAEYHFDEFISQEDRKVPRDIDVTLAIGSLNKKESEGAIEKGITIARAVNQARHWIDLPPTHLTPDDFVDHARKVAKARKLKLTVFSEKEIKSMGMGGLAAVSAGSDKDCHLVFLEYHVSKNAPTIAFVGKGITFDSGGLSLKPAVHMETMKEDMSGAAAVISTMDALGALKPDINIIGVTPLSENLPSGKATKPGDIARFYNGKTAEIKNTDAEGRLILADALAYTVKHYKPDAIIDVATLTGSCAHALGPFFCGLMSEDEDLVKRLYKAADRTGDRVWRLPLHDDYKPAIKSEVADLSNIGSQKYLAGAITAAHFLQNFVDDVPWAHLDIAGTAFDVPDLPYYRPHSATGFGVRLLVDLALEWKANKK